MAQKNTIHYQPSLGPMVFKQVTYTVCGVTGTATGYPGMVNCPDCKPVAQADLETAQKTNGKH